MALRYLVEKSSASMKQLLPANSSSYPGARGLCMLSSKPKPKSKSGSKPIYMPPERHFSRFMEENFAAKLEAYRKRYPHKVIFGVTDDLRLDKDDPGIHQMANHVIKHYNKETNAKLEFVNVLSACRGNTRPERHLVVQACDPLAARVPLKLKAVCNKSKRDGDMVSKILPPMPAPLMRIIDGTKDEDDIRNERNAYSETLLFANIRNCPIIDKRLGLKSKHGLPCRDHRAYVVKVSINDDILLAHAVFAVYQHNDDQNKASRVTFLRVVGAWLERIGKERVVYHIMLEALKGKTVKRRYYAAVASKPVNEDLELLEWVPANSPRPTMRCC